MTKLILFLPFLLLACANPDYGTPDSKIPTRSQDDPTPEKSKSCALRFVKLGICSDLAWTRAATDSDPGSLNLRLFSDVGAPVELPAGSTLFVFLWMPSMGHGSSPVTTNRTGTGHYDVSDVFFIMPGNWDIHLQIKSGSQVLDEVVIPYFYRGGA